jgi:hypothetical protein
MKTCTKCQQQFQVHKQDKEFYKTLDVPEPTLCYMCRMQRRLSYRNERFLYHRKCDFSGKQIISSFSVDKPFPVYENDTWWSDDWDELSYGRDFDFSRPFFEQFFELRNQVPRQALQQQKPMTNSDYCNCASRNKNCYLVFSTNYCEDCYYGTWVNYSKNCLDCKNILNCEICYECIWCSDSYNLRYCQDCNNCQNSLFLKNCQNCQDCFMCFNLVGKKYHIYNKAYTKEEYQDFMSKIDTGSYQVIKKLKDYWQNFSQDLIVKEFHGTQVENCIGDYLRNCKNCFTSFECDNCEDVRYCMAINNSKNCMDYSYWGQNAEYIYECQACGYEVNNLKFCNLCWSNCSDLTYCDQSFSSQNSFGCVSLKRKQYCILNKQYTKQEYQELVPKIIQHMKQTGEWGEFFPTSQSIYAYNETLAWEQIPLSKEEIEAKDWPYHDVYKDKSYQGPKYNTPDNISDVTDNITTNILTSKKSTLPFKIIPQELKFYKDNKIPIPRLTPDERHFIRHSKVNLRKLYNRTCANCQTPIQTTYSPDRPETVYCESCYLKTVY